MSAFDQVADNLGLNDEGALTATTPQTFASAPQQSTPTVPQLPEPPEVSGPGPVAGTDRTPQPESAAQVTQRMLIQRMLDRDKRLEGFKNHSAALDTIIQSMLQPGALQQYMPKPTPSQMLQDALHNFGELQLRNPYYGNSNMGPYVPIQQQRLKQAMDLHNAQLQDVSQARQALTTSMHDELAQDTSDRQDLLGVAGQLLKEKTEADRIKAVQEKQAETARHNQALEKFKSAVQDWTQNPNNPTYKLKVQQALNDSLGAGHPELMLARALGGEVDSPAQAKAMVDSVQRLQAMKLAGQLQVAGVHAAAGASDKANNRSDKSYQFNVGELDKLGKPIEDRLGRMANLQASVNQMTPQADSLIAPELLTVMAGGQGSGMRMNEAEIARIVGGRTHLESIKAALNKWQLDPAKGLSITLPQRQQIRDLMNAVTDKLMRKANILTDARQALVNTDDVSSHRFIVAGAHKGLLDIDNEGAQDTQTPGLPFGRPAAPAAPRAPGTSSTRPTPHTGQPTFGGVPLNLGGR